jgi:hypothetical protein
MVFYNYPQLLEKGNLSRWIDILLGKKCWVDYRFLLKSWVCFFMASRTSRHGYSYRLFHSSHYSALTASIPFPSIAQRNHIDNDIAEYKTPIHHFPFPNSARRLRGKYHLNDFIVMNTKRSRGADRLLLYLKTGASCSAK